MWRERTTAQNPAIEAQSDLPMGSYARLEMSYLRTTDEMPNRCKRFEKKLLECAAHQPYDNALRANGTAYAAGGLCELASTASL